jgi:hypothetical protein
MTTGASALNAAMTAVVAALNGDSTFVSLCAGKARDAVPQDVAYPYVWVAVREDPGAMETFGRMGQEVFWTLQVYDKDDDHEGSHRIDAVIARIVALLHHAALTLTGWAMPLIHYEGSQDMPLLTDADGIVIRSKLLRFRGLAETAA